MRSTFAMASPRILRALLAFHLQAPKRLRCLTLLCILYTVFRSHANKSQPRRSRERREEPAPQRPTHCEPHASDISFLRGRGSLSLSSGVGEMSGRMRWGMVGGGRGSQVGVAHKVAACMDGLFEFSAGAADIDPAKSRADGIGLGLPEDRAYGTWREMLDAERQRSDRLDLV